MTVLDLIANNSTVLIVLSIVLGLLVGSFLNVVIYRVPVMLQREWRQQCCEFLELDEKKFSKDDPTAKHKIFNLVKPDSHCPQCNAPVRAWQNIPILSYVMLHGKCAGCQKPISMRYPVIELVTGLLSGLVAWQFGATWLTLAFLVLTIAGERLELTDPVGENILDFEYKDGWYPAADGSGRSLEVHVFPPGVKIGEGHYAWNLRKGSMMTNGTVGKVTVGPKGRELQISYPTGQRRVVVCRPLLSISRTSPVGTYPANPYGLHDMIGNVWEWTTDARGQERRTVGGSWWYGAFNMKADVMAFKPADFYAVYIGFRCAYDLKAPK